MNGLDAVEPARPEPISSVATSLPLTARIAAALEWPIAVLALAIIPVMLFDDGATTPTTHALATAVNWFIWIAFCGEFAVRWHAAADKRAFIRSAWFDLLVIFLSPPFWVPEAWQGARALRAVRLLRMARMLRAVAVLSIGLRASRRVLRHHHFHYVLVATAAMVLVGAAGLYVFERDMNESVRSFGDALWWAVTTTTTVGYGDVYPKTGEGRVIAVVLMLTGIGVIGTFTATVASLFMTKEESSELSDLRERLERIEGKLDQLTASTEM